MRTGLATLITILSLTAVAAPASALLPTPNPVYDPTPAYPDAIDEVHRVAFHETMTSLWLNSTFVIYEVGFGETGPRTADDLRGPAAGVLQPVLEQNLLAVVRGSLATAFPNATIEVALVERAYGAGNGDLDPYRPGAVLTTSALVVLGHEYFFGAEIPGLDLAELTRGVFAAGGRFHADLALQPLPGHRVAYDIAVPGWLTVLGGASDGHLRGLLDNFRGDSHEGLVVEIRDPAAAGNLASYEAEGVDVEVLVDISEPHISLLGGAETVAVGVGIDIEMHHLAMPEGIRALLPATIRMEHVNADFIRLAAANHLLDRSAFADALAGVVEWNVQYVMGEEATVSVDRDLLLATLSAPYDPAQMDSGLPIRLSADGRLVQNLTADAAPEAPVAALASFGPLGGGIASPFQRTVLPTQEYFLKSFYDWNTTYTVLYPRGMDLWLNDTAGRAEPIEKGGREGFRVTLAGGEAHYLQATPSYGAAFLLTLIPIVPVMVALGVAGLATTGALAIAKRRKKGASS